MPVPTSSNYFSSMHPISVHSQAQNQVRLFKGNVQRQKMKDQVLRRKGYGLFREWPPLRQGQAPFRFGGLIHGGYAHIR